METLKQEAIRVISWCMVVHDVVHGVRSCFVNQSCQCKANVSGH